MNAPTVRAALAQSGLVPVDAQVLLAHVVGQNRAWLIAHAGDALTSTQAHDFFALAKRRRDGEPVAYLVGVREFHGVSLQVTPDVLIPRPETETLVECALAAMQRSDPVSVLDLGTGSGAIALAIAAARPDAIIVATDRSAKALAVARANAARLNLGNVTCVESDWYSALSGRTFDVIVSNPPYIAGGDSHLAEGDLRFEPQDALTPGGDGLSALRRIVHDAPRHLAPGGWLGVEHGYDQSEAVLGLFRDTGFVDVRATRDLAGIPRVASGRLA
ncbi:MAG: peptide chain release factor N(5)-glutamine methyltransferase [Proteobacteria bacterium]|nr:peptide chain release factor N(5)-glutamine methyltransferase [Pseudomonadota bacterium]